MTLSPGPSTSRPPAPLSGAPTLLTPAGRATGRPSPNRLVGRSTPAILRAFGLACGVGTLLFGSALWSGVRAHRDGFQSLGRDAGPSVIATQNIKSALSDMDANLLNQLLVPPEDASRREVRDAVRLYEERRAQFGEALIGAAQNITYGDAERRPITAIQLETGRYERLGAQALLSHQRGDEARAREFYQQAGAVLQDRLLPAARALDKANDDALQNVFRAQQGRALRAMVWLWLSALLLLGPLVALQLFLARRTRRTLNAGLGAATLLVLALLLGATRTFAGASESLRGAKKDAFDSVGALSRARAVAFDLNADESRWLFLPAQKARYERDFLGKVAQLATLSPTDSPEQRIAAVLQASQGREVPREFQGYLADELRNITFVGERDSAERTATSFAHYLALDPKIRALDGSGKHEEAVRFCISYAPGASNEAYSKFAAALDNTLKINTDAFKRLTDEGFAGLQNREWLNGLGLVVVLALLSLGLRARLHEYRG